MTGAGLSGAAAFSGAAGILVAIGLILYAVSGPRGDPPANGKQVRGFWYLVLGRDNRVSTSKVQFAMWTIALSYAFLVFTLRSDGFPNAPLDPSYLLLLGFPAGAAIGASVITTAKIQNGTADKTPAPDPAKKPAQALREIVSNDSGHTDIGDAQYFVFNLVALTTFFVGLFHDPTRLPVLPATLVGLTSASAATYVLKKAAASDQIAISAVVPQKARPGAALIISGNNLCGPGYSATDPTTFPSVTVGGLKAVVDDARSTQDAVHVRVPDTASPGFAAVSVVTSGGITARLDAAVDVLPSPVITGVWPASVVLGAGAGVDLTLDLDGDGFLGPDDASTAPPTVLLDGRAVALDTRVAPTPKHLRALLPTTAAELAHFAKGRPIAVTVLDPARKGSAPVTLAVADVVLPPPPAPSI